MGSNSIITVTCVKQEISLRSPASSPETQKSVGNGNDTDSGVFRTRLPASSESLICHSKAEKCNFSQAFLEVSQLIPDVWVFHCIWKSEHTESPACSSAVDSNMRNSQSCFRNVFKFVVSLILKVCLKACLLFTSALSATGFVQNLGIFQIRESWRSSSANWSYWVKLMFKWKLV